MVTKITETEMAELMEKINDGKFKGEWSAVHLGSKAIQKWIETGKFKHIKNELQNYHSVRFGCLKEENKCSYIFFGPKPAIMRISNMLNDLIEDKYEHILNLPNDRIITSKYTGYDKFQGVPNSCPLF